MTKSRQDTRPAPPVQRHEIEAWLGYAIDAMTPEEVDLMHRVAQAWADSPVYDPTETDVVMTGALSHLMGDLDLIELGNTYRRCYSELKMMTLGAILAGKPEREAAKESTLDRGTIRRIQGK